MVLVFLVAEGVLYVNQIRRGTTINAVYIKKALERFLVFFKKRPNVSSQERFLHWEIVSVHAHSLSVQEFLVVKKHEDDTPSLYLPDVTIRGKVGAG